MAKGKKGRETAQELYISATLSNAEIAELAGVSERTLTKWISDGGWKKQRALRNLTAQDMEADIVEILANAAKSRRESTSAIERAQIADEAVKWNKILENIRKDSRLSLNAHIQVMRDFLDFSNTRYPKLMSQLIEAQKAYVTHKAAEYL